MELQDYLDLIPGPNVSQPMFMAWLDANLQLFIDCMALLDSIPTEFDIDNAVGKQLDIIGEILNLPREVRFQPDGPVSPILEDDKYRIILKARILQNQWKGTKQEIYDFWNIFFPTSPALIQDNQDMSMSVIVVGMSNETDGIPFFGFDMDTDEVKGFDEGYWDYFTGLSRRLVLEGYIVPKPAGVKVDYTFMEDPVFSFDMDTDLLKGFDEGHWASF